MKARIVPLYFDPGRDGDFDTQLHALDRLIGPQAELLPPLPLGAELPAADAVLFPQMLGQAYRQLDALKAIRLPILVVTSHFGTLSMWDWEIIDYLRCEGVETIAPYDLEQTKKICRALAVKRQLKQAKFLVYQDNPGEGFQASIFKRFYWWEEECTQRIQDRFGLTIVRKSFRELGAAAKAIPDDQAEEVWKQRQSPTAGISRPATLAAVKLCMAVKQDLDRDQAIGGAGINCLNESHFSHTTPCLAWNMLYQQQGLIWGCEADTMSMLTKYILHNSLGVPLMMTNLYPFVLGDAALKHERIDSFSAGERRTRKPHPGGPLRLHGGNSRTVRDGVDIAEKGAGHRGRKRDGHRRTPAHRRCNLGQASPDNGPHDRGAGPTDRLRPVPQFRLPQWRGDSGV